LTNHKQASDSEDDEMDPEKEADPTSQNDTTDLRLLTADQDDVSNPWLLGNKRNKDGNRDEGMDVFYLVLCYPHAHIHSLFLIDLPHHSKPKPLIVTGLLIRPIAKSKFYSINSDGTTTLGQKHEFTSLVIIRLSRGYKAPFERT